MEVLTELTDNINLEDDEVEEEQARVSLRRLSSKPSSRRRRRSSARFLKLNEDAPEEDHLATTQDLGEVYQNAIRMNAENKINATNSWNLNLIDHMDRFLGRASLNAASSSRNTGNAMGTDQLMEDTYGVVTGVNFTKASCTLDASVKIYSYRVDDVHLTSYKVLANLNRTDNGKKRDAEESIVVDSAKEAERQERRAARANADTLETNLANINIHKLDAAFDIDPLFHKMSKTFDEGGAKGLLLANLNVSSQGCNIVFDSTLDTEENRQESEEMPEPSSVDMTGLSARIEISLNGQSINQLPLVPQLASLRAEYAQLNEEGFVDKSSPSERYAAPQHEEAEADRSIHVEAIERSRASQADLGRSMMAEQDSDDWDDDGDDAGGGFAFGGDDEDDNNEDSGDGFPVSFIHDGDHRFSSESFQTTFEASMPPSQATVLLDAIAAGDISGSQSNYEYFNKKALESIQGNQWAGAAHWKKVQPRKKIRAITSDKDAPGASVKKKKRGKTGAIGGLLLDIKTSNVDATLFLKKAPKGRKGSSPLQLTKAAISKASKDENLLPMDAGIQVENFTSLFSRPNTNIRDLVIPQTAPKQVGFGGVETWGNIVETSFGDADDDGGFAFGSDYDDGDQETGDFIPELEGVRKVEKVKVGYATVAKKVDVKRLKQDLWEELERTFSARGIKVPADDHNAGKDDESDDHMIGVAVDSEQLEQSFKSSTRQEPLSFKACVKEMQSAQSQTDVTLPFYFICILHLANEKGLALESQGLEDFVINCS